MGRDMSAVRHHAPSTDEKKKALEVVCLRYWNKACRHGHDLLRLNFYTSKELCDKQQKVGTSLYVV